VPPGPPGPGLPTPPGGWIRVEPEPAPPPGQPWGAPAPGPGSPYGSGAPYQTYQPPAYGGYQYYGAPTRSSAGFGARLGAVIIDGLLAGLLPAIIYYVGVGTGTARNCSTSTTSFGGVSTTCNQPDVGYILPFIGAAFVLGLALAFFVVIRPIGTTGQSIGCRATGIRVVDATTGTPIGIGRAFGRHLAATFVSGWFCYIGYLWMLWDDRKQTLHDKIVSAVVVTA